ncbi:MAG: hypothetical protein J0L62_01455 [Bacteroidetes bacterium]|nr:hypothetical protein [Bacteroidota bacterium]
MKLVARYINIVLVVVLFLNCEPSNNSTNDPPDNPEVKLVIGPAMKKGAINNDTYFFFSNFDSIYSLNNGVLVNITPVDGIIGSPSDIKVFLNHVIISTKSGNLYQYEISGKTWLSKTGMGDVYSTTYFLNFRPTDNKLFMTTPGIEYNSGNLTWIIDFPFNAATKPSQYGIKLSNGKIFSTIRNFYVGTTNLVMMGIALESEYYVVFQEHGKDAQFTLISKEDRYFKLFPFGTDKFLGNYGVISKAQWYKTSLFDFSENVEWVFEKEKTVISSKNAYLYQSVISEQIAGFSITGKKAIVSDKKVTFLAGDATQIVYQDQNTKQIYQQIIEK